MSSTYSWMRWTSSAFLASLMILAAPAKTQESSIHISPVFRDGSGMGFALYSSAEDISDRLGQDMQSFVQSATSCSELLSIPAGAMHPQDLSNQTWFVALSIRTECWVISQIPQKPTIVGLADSEYIDRNIVYAIMDFVAPIAAHDDPLGRTLMWIENGETTCEKAWRCALVQPDGRIPPERSVDFELLAVYGEDWFVSVTQMVYGRPGYVYGVRLEVLDGQARVVSIFTD